MTWFLFFHRGSAGIVLDISKLAFSIRVSQSSQVMMAHQRCGEEDAEAILSNLKMEGRLLSRHF